MDPQPQSHPDHGTYSRNADPAMSAEFAKPDIAMTY
jgi:hypothetical protein